MSLGREFKTCFVSLILLISLLSVFVTIPENVRAEFTEGTNIYFHDFLLIGEMDQNIPTEENGSAWPPSISNTEEWLMWLTLWLEYKELMDETEEFDFYGFHPFKITEFYMYDGEENLEIKGDVVFNLYFSSTLLTKISNDEVNVSIYHEDFSESTTNEYNTTTKIRSTLSGGKTQLTTVIIEDVDFELSSEDLLTFSVEIIPSEKFIREIIENLNQTINQTMIEEIMGLVEPLVDLLTNQSLIPELSEIGLLIKDILNQSGDFLGENLSIIADLVNAVVSSSFIYDSVQYPSSVTLPVEMPGNEDNKEDENVKKYYLHSGNEMNEEKPLSTEPSEFSLSTSSKWDGPNLETSKILKEAVASLYIEHQNILRLVNILKGKIQVTAKLLYKNNEIASSQKELDWTIFLDILPVPELMIFTFDDLGDHEIEHGESLSLEVSANVGGESIGRYAKLLYDSGDYPSSLTVKFDETDHIEVTAAQPSSQEVALGGSVIYTLDITSDFEENEVSIAPAGFSSIENQKWDIDLPGSFNISAGGQKTVNVTVTSTGTEDDLDDYDSTLNVTFVVTGDTGKAMFEAEVEISKDVVEYDIVVIVPPGQKVKHGETGTYHFKIKNNNTGFLPDSYTVEVSSENGWNLSYDQDVEELAFEEEAEINVTISVPKDTDVPSDVLTFTVTSDQNEDTSVTIKVTTAVIGPNILEMLYGFFESSAENFGLDEVFGSSYLAAVVLASIIFIVIFLIIIILVYFLTIKYVNFVCLGRIKEISPDEEARFEITIQNPFKTKLSYEIHAQNSFSSTGWEVSLDVESIMLEPRQSKKVILTVKPTDYVKPDDWAEVKVVAKVLEKHKSAKISTVTTIKDAKAELRIYGVFHWPRVFKKGDIVTTSFKLENKGNAAASDVSVVLYVNGEEKNKVEDITIPRSGYADIEMPWIAVKGKNEVDIVVK